MGLDHGARHLHAREARAQSDPTRKLRERKTELDTEAYRRALEHGTGRLPKGPDHPHDARTRAQARASERERAAIETESGSGA